MLRKSRPDVRIARGLHIQSLRLGLIGRADVVEFHRVAENAAGTRSEPRVRTSGTPAKDSNPPQDTVRQHDDPPESTLSLPLARGEGFFRAATVRLRR